MQSLGHRDARGRMVQRLLLGMFAPLTFVFVTPPTRGGGPRRGADRRRAAHAYLAKLRYAQAYAWMSGLPPGTTLSPAKCRWPRS
jgi:hypothetical protein